MLHFQTPPMAPYSRDQIAGELAKLTTAGRFDAAEVNRLLAALIVHRADVYGEARLDANETAVLLQQLEFLRARTTDIERPEFKARMLVPITSEVDPGAETWAYTQWDRVGMAKIVANYADDIPKVATFAKKFVQTVETIALGYGWSWLDLQRTARAGVPLRTRLAQAVRDGFESRIEVIGAIGIAETGATGLLNSANVPAIAAAAPATGSSTVWGGADKTPLEVVSDLLAMENAIVNNTKGVRSADTLILPLAKLTYIAQKSIYNTAPSNPMDTILSVFLAKSRTITNVEFWHFADTVNTGSTPRATMYKRDPTVVHLEVPLEQQEMPPQAKNLSLEINSVGRIGGVAWEYPLAAVYMNGI
jgi:hypothetical protein